MTGYMFGKGVYFADSSSKSANYCHATCVVTSERRLFCLLTIDVRSKAQPFGVLALCEVALGDMYPVRPRASVVDCRSI